MSKIEAVVNAPMPDNVSSLRSFLGLVSYYRQFMGNLSTIAHPLNCLLEKSASWRWTDREQGALEQLKKLLVEAPVLAHYDPAMPLVLACDASGTGVGAVLSHVTPEGERPVAYASKSLSKTQQQYSQLEREAYEIVPGVTKFHEFLFGQQFTLITDNQPLPVIFGPKRTIPTIAAMRLQRWGMILAACDYTVQLKASKENGNADCLSRLSWPRRSEDVCEVSQIICQQQSQLPLTASDVAAATQEDQFNNVQSTEVCAEWMASECITTASQVQESSRRANLCEWLSPACVTNSDPYSAEIQTIARMETGLLARRRHNQLRRRNDSEVLTPPIPPVVAPRPDVRRSICLRRVPARLQE